jgi:hypothetical protein
MPGSRPCTPRCSDELERCYHWRMHLRAMPIVGASVQIRYLGATARGTVREVDVDARRLVVLAEDGEMIAFTLNAATATFTADGSQEGARLSFEHGGPPG